MFDPFSQNLFFRFRRYTFSYLPRPRPPSPRPCTHGAPPPPLALLCTPLFRRLPPSPIGPPVPARAETCAHALPQPGGRRGFGGCWFHGSGRGSDGDGGGAAVVCLPTIDDVLSLARRRTIRTSSALRATVVRRGLATASAPRARSGAPPCRGQGVRFGDVPEAEPPVELRLRVPRGVVGAAGGSNPRMRTKRDKCAQRQPRERDACRIRGGRRRCYRRPRCRQSLEGQLDAAVPDDVYPVGYF